MAAYPRELNLDSLTEERLLSYLENELLNHYSERGPWMDRLLQWQRDYWAEPINKKATFPFVGASTLVVPLTAIALEAVHARTMTTLFAIDQLVSATFVSSRWSDHARPVERFMNRELMGQMEARKKLEPCILEIEKYGTGVGKVAYEKVIKTALRPMPDGTEIEVPVTLRDGAVVDSVSFGRFLMPLSATSPQTAPWCGEEHSLSPYEVAGLEESGFFKPGTVKKLEAWIVKGQQSATGVENKFRQSQEALEARKPVWPNLIDWVEIWLGFNVDGGPNNKEIVVHYHRPSRTLLSVRYNWHDDLRRPYRTGVYFPIEHRWTGIGICKQNEQFQRELTTQHRQRLDNATLANMRMIKISKLSGYKPDEPIFPGKMWFVDDMTHVDTFQLGEVYNSAFNNEQATLMYSERRTGVNDTILGATVQGTPGTATGDLARIQEGGKKFDYAYGNIKTFVSELILDTAVTVAQFGPRRWEYYDTVEGGQYVREFFSAPVELIRNNLLVELRASGQQQNKILDRNNWQVIGVTMQQYYQGMLQLAQFAGNPQLMQYIAMKGLSAGTEAMRQFLESFDRPNIDRLILSELLQPGAMPNASGGNNQQLMLPGGNGGPAAVGPQSGMDLLGTLVQAAGGGGQPGVPQLSQRTGGL